MKIIFEKDSRNGYEEFFAISQMEIWKGKVYDELMWAEIRLVVTRLFRVVWEDAWQAPEFKTTLDEAKAFILQNYAKHTPHINGAAFSIEEL
jgi:hypothetical protein